MTIWHEIHLSIKSYRTPLFAGETNIIKHIFVKMYDIVS